MTILFSPRQQTCSSTDTTPGCCAGLRRNSTRPSHDGGAPMHGPSATCAPGAAAEGAALVAVFAPRRCAATTQSVERAGRRMGTDGTGRRGRRRRRAVSRGSAGCGTATTSFGPEAWPRPSAASRWDDRGAWEAGRWVVLLDVDYRAGRQFEPGSTGLDAAGGRTTRTDLVRWNLHKAYLLEAGVVGPRGCRPGWSSRGDLSLHRGGRCRWLGRDVVVKPAAAATARSRSTRPGGTIW